jgi:hypothetical protein
MLFELIPVPSAKRFDFVRSAEMRRHSFTENEIGKLTNRKDVKPCPLGPGDRVRVFEDVL